MQVAGVYVCTTLQGTTWSNVVCELNVEEKMLIKVQGGDVSARCHLMHPGAEYMVFELAPPQDVSTLEKRALHLPSVITCALVTAPCVILRVTLLALTAADLQAVCAAAHAPASSAQRRYHLQLHSVASSGQWMVQQSKPPKEWGEKKGLPRKPASTPKKRRTRAAEVLEEEDELLDEAVEDVEEEGEDDSDDVEDGNGEVEGEEDDVDEPGDEAADDAEELELEEDEDEEEEEVDDAVSANSTEEEADEADEAQAKREVKKARRG